MLHVGFLAGGANEATPAIDAEFRRRQPGWRAEMRQAPWSDPTGGLAAGSVDVGLLRMPFPGQEAWRSVELFSEPRWVAPPADHPLAARTTIPFRDLWDEPFVAAPARTGAWRDYWPATDEREGRPVRIGAVVDQPDDWLGAIAIANGYGVALAPASAARFYARPTVVHRPAEGVSPSSAGVVRAPADDADPVVRNFVSCCVDTATAASPGGGTPGKPCT